jgi:EmrB/QacA subfamily drug resistance transporter
MRSRTPLLVLLCTAQFVDVLDVNAVLVALPVIGRDLGLSGGGLQWVVTAYVLVFAGFLLLAGRLADAVGRRRVFTAGLGLFTLASLACGVAPSPETLVAARAVQGLGAALTAPAALAMIVDAFPAGAARERAVAAWTAVAAVGGAAGLVLGGLIAGGPGWRWIFLINVPVGLAALALTPRLLTESRAATDRPGGLDLPGACAATGGLGLLVLALAQGEQDGPLAPITLVALAGAAALLTALLVRERAAADPLVPSKLMATRPLIVAIVVAAVLTATTSGGGVLATLLLQDALALSPAAAALHLLPLSVSVVAGSAIASRLPSTSRPTIVAGLALVAAGSVVAAASQTATGIVVWAILAGLGLGAASVAATTLGVSAVGEDHRATAAGLLSTAAQVGTAFGVATLLLLADRRLGFVVAAALAVALAVVVAGAWARTRGVRERQTA